MALATDKAKKFYSERGNMARVIRYAIAWSEGDVCRPIHKSAEDAEAELEEHNPMSKGYWTPRYLEDWEKREAQKIYDDAMIFGFEIISSPAYATREEALEAQERCQEFVGFDLKRFHGRLFRDEHAYQDDSGSWHCKVYRLITEEQEAE